MALLLKHESYLVAEAVLAIVATLMDADQSCDSDIMVGGFTNSGNTGLALKSGDLKRRCNLFGDQRSDGIAMVIGGYGDFDHRTGHAHETANRYYFERGEHYQAAQFVVEWLCNGEVAHPSKLDNDPSAPSL